MGQRHGYAFEAEISKSLRTLRDTFHHKLADTHAFSKCPRCGYDLRIILPKQPGDFLVVRRGHAIMLECKSTRNAVSWNVHSIRPHQLEAAVKWEKAGGTYWFLLCRRVPYQMKVWAIRPNEVLNIMAGMRTKNQVRWAEVIKRSIELERNTKRRSWVGLGNVLDTR